MVTMFYLIAQKAEEIMRSFNFFFLQVSELDWERFWTFFYVGFAGLWNLGERLEISYFNHNDLERGEGIERMSLKNEKFQLNEPIVVVFFFSFCFIIIWKSKYLHSQNLGPASNLFLITEN